MLAEFHFPCSVERVPFPDGFFDCVYSFATFEHFRDPDGAAAELFRITKPGGVNYHSVDLRDHRNFNEPLEFLTLSAEQWRDVGGRLPGYSHTNRLRSSEIAACFARQGFKPLRDLPFLRRSVSADLRSRLHSDYHPLSDRELGILGCVYIFQK